MGAPGGHAVLVQRLCRAVHRGPRGRVGWLQRHGLWRARQRGRARCRSRLRRRHWCRRRALVGRLELASSRGAWPSGCSGRLRLGRGRRQQQQRRPQEGPQWWTPWRHRAGRLYRHKVGTQGRSWPGRGVPCGRTAQGLRRVGGSAGRAGGRPRLVPRRLRRHHPCHRGSRRPRRSARGRTLLGVAAGPDVAERRGAAAQRRGELGRLHRVPRAVALGGGRGRRPLRGGGRPFLGAPRARGLLAGDGGPAVGRLLGASALPDRPQGSTLR
mmetsp:Transcript_29778/g.98799  ORF Transcript_29778/g.98799 Transcript_29778/m.98799 type:complete len:270 (+) Transcript_29778:605-1414(+)